MLKKTCNFVIWKIWFYLPQQYMLFDTPTKVRNAEYYQWRCSLRYGSLGPGTSGSVITWNLMTMAIREGIAFVECLSMMEHLTANQCEERPQVTPLNLYPRFRYNSWWVDLMAIEYEFVWVVGHYHLHTWVKGVENFSNHPPNYERLHRPRHGWRDRYLYFAQEMLWLNGSKRMHSMIHSELLIGHW